MNITEYVAEQGITAEIVEDLGLQRDAEGWQHYGYRVRLHRGEDMTPVFDWRQGTGITDDPEDRPDTILDSLVSDAHGYDDARDFEDFAAEFGYDTDSRRAEQLYNACGDVSGWLHAFLGDDYERVAYEIERL